MSQGQSERARTVLIAEDDEGLRLSLEMLLRREGFVVTGVAGGDDAVERLARQRFDLVLTDLRMPGRDGIAVLQETKRLQPGAPVVFMTCYGDMDTYMEAMDEGAFEYVNKPLARDELVALMRRALGLPEPEVRGPAARRPERECAAPPPPSDSGPHFAMPDRRGPPTGGPPAKPLQ